MIEVIKNDSMPHVVMLDGKITGYIHQVGVMYKYVPKGSRLSEGGEPMPSVDEVIESLN